MSDWVRRSGLSLQVLHRRISSSSAARRRSAAAGGAETLSPEFIQQQVEEFNTGRRHLANMMNEDPESFSQEDIDVRKHSDLCRRTVERGSG